MILTKEGKNFLLAAGQGKISGVSLYLAVYANDYEVLDTDTATTFIAAAGELTTQYDETTRILFDSTEANGESTATAIFTFNDSVTFYGIALFTSSVKADDECVLIAGGKFSTPKSYVAGDAVPIDVVLRL
jgi:hypothetical protein